MHLEPLPLFPYQAEAADIMAKRDYFGLHDEMGIGKTATTIGAINRILGVRGMIVCPAMLRENWIREFKRFSTYSLRLCKGKTIHDYIAWQRGHFDVLVTSYAQAAKWAADFNKRCEVLDFLVFDEAHYLKNLESNRTRALLGIDASGEDGLTFWAEHVYHLTGTPMANDPMDIYTFLRFVKAFDLSPEDFRETFFDSHLGVFKSKHYPKEEMVSTLNALITNNSIRRTHQDVGMELPDIRMVSLFLDGNMKDLETALSGYPHVEEQITYALQTGDMSALDAAHIATIRRIVGKAKTVPYAQLLRHELDAGAGKRVVFCVHTEPLLYLKNYLEKYGYDVVVAYGETPEHERVDAVERFMNDPKCKVFIGKIAVAGTGLTLTSSHQVDMLESDWTPAGNAQALKRVHRYGQEHPVLARFITLAGTIDETVTSIVADKTARIARIEGFTMNTAPLDTGVNQS